MIAFERIFSLIRKICAAIPFTIIGFSLSGCAVLHHVQIGEIDNRTGLKTKPIDIKVSETGVNIGEAAEVGKALASAKSEEIEQVRQFISLFQLGPRTGNPVYRDNYAAGMTKLILAECPTGRVTRLMAIREMRKYPVISGEIVKVTGECILD